MRGRSSPVPTVRGKQHREATAGSRDQAGERGQGAVGHPVHQRNGSPRTTGPDQLVGRALVIGCEHDAESRGHDVEACVLHRQGLRVASPVVHGQSTGVRSNPGLGEQLGGEVDPDDTRASSLRCQGDVARSGRDVERRLTTQVAEASDEPIGDWLKGHRHAPVVSQGPGAGLLGAVIQRRQDDFRAVSHGRLWLSQHE